MSVSARSLLTCLVLALSLAGLPVVKAAAPCAAAQGADGHAAHALHEMAAAGEMGMVMAMDMTVDTAGDCCDDSALCPLQACQTAAALPALPLAMPILPAVGPLAPAPLLAVISAPSRLERPPITA